MKKLSFLLPALILMWACSKDDDSSDSDSNNYSVSATVDGGSFSVAQNSTGFSAASSGGTSQINALNSNEAGFKIFMPENTVTGSQDLDTSFIGITYSNDWSVFGNYTIDKGSISITQFAAWPIVLKANFEGWAFNNTNADDSIYIGNGVVNVNLN